VTKLAALLALGALVLGGCSGDDKKPSSQPSTEKIETTKVKVVEGSGGSGGGYDAEGIYKRESPGVVTVLSLLGDSGGGLLGGGGKDQAGQGSGFVLDDKGHIATNAHVVTSGEGSKIKKAKKVFVQFADHNQVPAKIIGVDPDSDVGLIQVDPKGLDLTPLPLGSSSDLKVGEPVATLGSPFGEEQSLSVGIVSAIGRDIQSLTQFRIGNAIQTDAGINPGNSGGPLLDGAGKVIGINAQIQSKSGGGEGVGFAVPVNTIRRSLDQLRTNGKVAYAFLGVTSQPLYPQLAKALGIDADAGALVVNVQKGSPAADAGIKAGDQKIEFQGIRGTPKGGDAVIAVDGRKVTGPNDLSNIIALKKPGQEVTLEVLRGKDKREVKAKLAPRKPSAPPPDAGNGP
jgi:S1-C subfamily serine protease